jgi:hydrogenase expression/formation protein HypD
MAASNRYRDKNVISALVREISEIRRSIGAPCRIMEVCGTHTMTIHRYGLGAMLEDAGVEMVSGPGCPVCITPNAFHEAAIDLLTRPGDLILATFGDMTRVPTRKGSIQGTAPARGSSVKIVYSPDESLELARANPAKEVVFFGVGFETTIPSIAVSAKTAAAEKLPNYSILSALWTIPPPLRAVLESGEVRLSGFLYPGHVSAIIGEGPYRFVAEEFGYPGAIAGFEPVDILLGVHSVLRQIDAGKPEVANEYTRVVRPEGNPVAEAVMAEVLEPSDACWRGLGTIPASGLKFREALAPWDAERKFALSIEPRESDLPGCRCGEVLRGVLPPPRCPLFGKACSPDSPQGPCMVSFEGSCLVHFKYKARK